MARVDTQYLDAALRKSEESADALLRNLEVEQNQKEARSNAIEQTGAGKAAFWTGLGYGAKYGVIVISAGCFLVLAGIGCSYAIDQLQVWAAKVKVDIIKSEINSDPASVAFKTAEFAKKNQIDIALIDTAGRLQNKKNLMEEYKKIINVLKKIDPSYPNEVILVLDATTGQNALNQVEEFSKIHELTGLIITKLDSTAKGGVVLAICKKYKLPIVAIGMGEKENDLHPFNAEYFSKALLGIED